MLTKFKTRAKVNKKTALKLLKNIAVVALSILGLGVSLLVLFSGSQNLIANYGTWMVWVMVVTAVSAVLALANSVFTIIKIVSPKNVKAVKASVQEKTLDEKIKIYVDTKESMKVLIKDIQTSKELQNKKQAERDAILRQIGSELINDEMNKLHNGAK